MKDLFSKINGNLTGPSAVVIAVILILGEVGVLGPTRQDTFDAFHQRMDRIEAHAKATDERLLAMVERVGHEHANQAEAWRDISANLKELASHNKEMLLLIQNIHECVGRMERKGG